MYLQFFCVLYAMLIEDKARVTYELDPGLRTILGRLDGKRKFFFKLYLHWNEVVFITWDTAPFTPGNIITNNNILLDIINTPYQSLDAVGTKLPEYTERCLQLFYFMHVINNRLFGFIRIANDHDEDAEFLVFLNVGDNKFVLRPLGGVCEEQFFQAVDARDYISVIWDVPVNEQAIRESGLYGMHDMSSDLVYKKLIVKSQHKSSMDDLVGFCRRKVFNILS